MQQRSWGGGRWPNTYVGLYGRNLGICISRPGELARSIPQATRRVLDVQLTELVRHGLVDKKVFQEKVQHVEYELTELGGSLMPVIAVMGNWGNENLEQLKRLLQNGN